MEYAMGMVGRHATLARLRKSRRLPLTEAAYNGQHEVLQVGFPPGYWPWGCYLFVEVLSANYVALSAMRTLFLARLLNLRILWLSRPSCGDIHNGYCPSASRLLLPSFGFFVIFSLGLSRIQSALFLWFQQIATYVSIKISGYCRRTVSPEQADR